MALNYYQLLGVPPDADRQCIKAAYRSLAKRCHPDKNCGSPAATELFQQLNQAYRILSDPAQRKDYDASLPAAVRKARPKPPTAEAQPQSSAAKVADDAAKQKFSRFLNTLLDAIFEVPERAPPEAAHASRGSPPDRAGPKKRGPDFGFYYQLALARGTASYRRDDDGIYRRVTPERPAATSKKRRFGSSMSGGFVALLLVGLTALLMR